eukprot:6192159-Pleurochrysis_carterae.AAC.1
MLISSRRNLISHQFPFAAHAWPWLPEPYSYPCTTIRSTQVPRLAAAAAAGPCCDRDMRSLADAFPVHTDGTLLTIAPRARSRRSGRAWVAAGERADTERESGGRRGKGAGKTLKSATRLGSGTTLRQAEGKIHRQRDWQW